MTLRSKKNLIWLLIALIAFALYCLLPHSEIVIDPPPPPIPENQECVLQAVNVNRLVCAENGGRDSLVANRPTCGGSWEVFIIVKNDDGSFSLKSASNDKFVSAFPNGRMIAQGSAANAWEKFDLKPVHGKDGVFTLWSRNTQKYVSVDENISNVLRADRDVADAWEEFHISPLGANELSR